jgi:hypothetical protein
MTFGNVYVFNNFNEPISALNVASFQAGAVPAWTANGNAIYTPQFIKIPRVKHADERTSAAFAQDQANDVVAKWDSFIGHGVITMPAGDVSLDEDLILYLAVNQFTLLTTRGFVKQNVPIIPGAQTDSAWDSLASFADAARKLLGLPAGL